MDLTQGLIGFVLGVCFTLALIAGLRWADSDVADRDVGDEPMGGTD